MLEKFIKIKNIGKFENCSPEGDTSFKKITLIFSVNGYGKSTLADIIRSLSLGNSDIIRGRKTFGRSEEEEVELRLSGKNITFKSGSWSELYENIRVYDSIFVNENIYAGNIVDHKQKTNLFKVIIGQKGVKLTKELNNIHCQLKKLQKEIDELKENIESNLQIKDITSYISSKEPEDLDNKIRTLRQKFDSAKKASEIKSKATPETVNLIDFPPIDKILLRSIENLSKDAESKLRTHLNAFKEKIDSKWLSIGSSVDDDLNCPFCGQDIKRVTLVKAYRILFGSEYTELKSSVDKEISTLSSIDFKSQEIVLTKNTDLLSYWRQFVEIDEIQIDLNKANKIVTDLKQISIQILKKKKSNLLDKIEIEEPYHNHKKKFDELLKEVYNYNSILSVTKLKILDFKSKVEDLDMENIENELSKSLVWDKIKKNEDLAKKLSKYEDMNSEKDKLNREKRNKKDNLREYTEDIFPKYQKKINDYLECFDAGFKLVKTKQSFKGGKPSSDYQFQIKDNSFGIGNAESPKNVPSFKNTLSSGDKSTLSLAFFLTSLDIDNEEKEERIVVFDDPFTSQDRFRRSYTKDLIVQESKKSKQVILLSHNQDFLKHVWEQSQHDNNCKALQIVKRGGSSIIIEWSIDNEKKCVSNRDRNLLIEFVKDGNGDCDLVMVARAIRPWLESWIKQNFPNNFNSDSLGKMLEKILHSSEEDEIYRLKEVYDDLRGINNYATTFQHGEGNNAQKIDRSELTGYVKRTLRITRQKFPS